MWEFEMGKKYPESVVACYREFATSDMTLDFSLQDLEYDEKSRLDRMHLEARNISF